MKIYQVDSFTSKPFSGNPAGVCILEEPAEESWMKNIAAEMNLSETAFLYPEKDGYNLRWFTPEVEVELCGHATLASAHILFEKQIISTDHTIVFYTLSGELFASKNEGMIELNFPATPPVESVPPEGLIEAIGIEPEFVGKNKFDVFVVVSSEEQVRNLQPSLEIFKKYKYRGVIVTSKSDENPYDVVSRYFAPAVGIDEDPVTGSAHCTLSPFWSKKLGKDELFCFQASKRGGEVRVKIQGDRVILAGNAVTVFEIVTI
jgi:PhzF family phenazine biosynthesis protein